MSIRARICQILGEDSRNLLYWKRNLQKDTCGLGGDWQKFKRLRDQIMCGTQVWTKIGKATQNREKQEWAKKEKPKLDNARKLRGIYVVDPDDMGVQRNHSKHTDKTCELKTAKSSYQHREIDSGSNKIQKSKHACVVEAHESTRKHIGKLCRNIMMIALLGRRSIHWVICKSCAQVHTYASSNDYPGCQSRCGQRVWKAWKNARFAKWPIYREDRKLSWMHKKEQRTVLFLYADGHLSSQECGVTTEISKIPRQHCTPRWHSERRFWLWTEQVSSASQMAAAKVMDVIQGYRDVLYNQPAQYQLTSQSKWRTLPNYCSFQSQNVQIFGYVLTSKVLWFLLNEICTVTGLLWERQFEKSSIEIRLGKKYRTGNASSCIESKVYPDRYTWMNQKWLEDNNLNPMWKKMMKLVALGERNIFEKCKKMFESRISAGATQKLLGSENSHAKALAWFHDMEGHAKKCVERFLRPDKNKGSAIVFGLCSTHGRPPVQKRQCSKWWENGQKSALTSSWNACIWTEVVDLTFFALSTTCHELSKTCTRACDKRLAFVISYIHNTSDHMQFCHLGNAAQHCRLGLLQDTDFADDFEDSKSTSGRIVHIIHFLVRATAHLFSWAHTAHSVAQDKVVSASFTVIPRAHSHLVSLMLLLNVQCTPFSALLSPPSASSSGAPTSLLGRTRSWCRDPDAPARWPWSISPGAQSDGHPRQQPRFPVLRRRHPDFRYGHVSSRETRVGHVSSRSSHREIGAEL